MWAVKTLQGKQHQNGSPKDEQEPELRVEVGIKSSVQGEWGVQRPRQDKWVFWGKKKSADR